eukprot:332640-Pelagomonas_calceolata.AAC.4
MKVISNYASTMHSCKKYSTTTAHQSSRGLCQFCPQSTQDTVMSAKEIRVKSRQDSGPVKARFGSRQGKIWVKARQDSDQVKAIHN